MVNTNDCSSNYYGIWDVQIKGYDNGIINLKYLTQFEADWGQNLYKTSSCRLVIRLPKILSQNSRLSTY